MRWDSLIDKISDVLYVSHRERRKWHKWFAWHPVKITGTNRVVWLEIIERYMYDGMISSYWRYRFL